jgi:hypothetical protein
VKVGKVGLGREKEETVEVGDIFIGGLFAVVAILVMVGCYGAVVLWNDVELRQVGP